MTYIAGLSYAKFHQRAIAREFQLVQAEARLAASYQQQVPELSRSEALKLAAKHVRADVVAGVL